MSRALSIPSAIAFSSSVVLLAHACHGTLQDVDLASVKDILVSLRSVEAKLETFSVECTSTERIDLYGPNGRRLEGTTGVRTTKTAIWHRAKNGSWRYESTTTGNWIQSQGDRRRGGFVFISVFDADSGKGRHVVVAKNDNQVRQNIDDNAFHCDQLRPTEFTTDFGQKSVTELLEDGKAEVVEKTTLAGRPIIILQTATEVNGPAYHTYRRIWVDLERAVVVRRQTFSRPGDGKPWALVGEITCEDFKLSKEIGLWLPGSAKLLGWLMNEQDQRVLHTAMNFEFTNWKVTSAIDPKLFSPEQPLIPSVP